jgi:hypothetical protein
VDAKVVVTFSDGERIAVTDAELRLVYDELWSRAADVVGAVSTAGMIDHTLRRSRAGLGREIVLSERQTGAFRDALASLPRVPTS